MHDGNDDIGEQYNESKSEGSPNVKRITAHGEKFLHTHRFCSDTLFLTHCALRSRCNNSTRTRCIKAIK